MSLPNSEECIIRNTGEGTERSLSSVREAHQYLSSQVRQVIEDAVRDGSCTDSFEDRVEIAINVLIGFTINGTVISSEAARAMAIHMV